MEAKVNPKKEEKKTILTLVLLILPK